MKNISIFAIFLLVSFVGFGFEMSKAQIPICNKRFTLITGFCSDSTCYNTCKSKIGIGSTGKCDGFWTCECKYPCNDENPSNT